MTKTRVEWKGLIAYLGPRRLGFINSENAFVAPRKMGDEKGQGHYFYKFSGFGMNEELLQSLLEKNIQKTVIMIEKSKGRKLYICSTDTWLMRGKRYINKQDGVEEPQYILSEGQFDRIVEDFV